jgi:rod shape determining protein RodA
VISIVGILSIFSATRQPTEAAQPAFYIKQILWLIIGLFGLILFTSFNYIWLSRTAVIAYIAGLILLLLVLILGETGMGAKRWISLGTLSFQPSELFKLIFIIMLSKYLTNLLE